MQTLTRRLKLCNKAAVKLLFVAGLILVSSLVMTLLTPDFSISVYAQCGPVNCPPPPPSECELDVSDLSPVKATVDPENTVQFTLTLTAIQGSWIDFSVKVQIEPTQSELQIAIQGVPSQLSPGESAQVKLTVSVGRGVAPQMYKIRVIVKAKCGEMTSEKTRTVDLSVSEPGLSPLPGSGPLVFDPQRSGLLPPVIEPGLNPPAPACGDSPHTGDIVLTPYIPVPPPTNAEASYCGKVSAPLSSASPRFSVDVQDSSLHSVYLHNGEFFLYEVDLVIPGRGFDWSFSRKYRSRITYDGPLGHNWEFNYNARLVFQENGNILRMDGLARADEYTKNPDGSYTSPTGFYTSLVRNSDGSFTERDRTGTQRVFDSQGRLLSLSDRNGNTMRFRHNDQGQLIQVLDTLGRPIAYTYNADDRLIRVTDFSGRAITLEYDQNGDLISVTSPAVTGTPNGNDFPNGKTTRYFYSSGFSDEKLNHDLIAITAPNEVAHGGPPRIIVQYDTDPSSFSYGMVLKQTIGGTNASRIPAGGTILYEYEPLNVNANPSDVNLPLSRTTVVDRNGNLTEYEFNKLGNTVKMREYTNRNIRPNDPDFYETVNEYNRDGQLLRTILPEGNSIEYTYDDRNANRFQQGNVLRVTRRPDARRGGDQSAITTTFTYEPIYNQIRSVTEPRGNDASYRPQNAGATSASRYTTIHTFDYQEGSNFAALAQQVGLSEAQVRQFLQQAGIPMALGDVNQDGRTDQIAGNLIRRERPTVQLLPACPSDQLAQQDTNCSLQARLEGSSRQPIVELSQYNQFGQLLKVIDPEGNVDVYGYHPQNDPDGDGKDLTPGVGSGPFGYLKESVRDAESSAVRNSNANPAPAQIRHRYFYDRVGNLIQEIDGRGIATEYSVNQLNELVEIRSAADVTEALRNPEEPQWNNCRDQALVECTAGMVSFKYRTRLFYDFNGNLIQSEIENRDSNNQSLVGAFVEYAFKYDILDNVIEEAEEVSENPREILITRYRYDKNENRVLTISPVAVSGEQPSNVVSYVLDERDLLFTSTRGGLTDQFKALDGHADIPELMTIKSSPEISIYTRRYDGNRNLIESIDGADNNGDGKPESTLYLYDGFDRQVSTIDAVGNQSFTEYDPASNVVRASSFGPVGGPSPTSNAAATFQQPLRLQDLKQPLLAQVEYKYDEVSRMFERNDRLFVYQGVEYKRAPALRDGPLGTSNDGIVVTRYEYDRNSRRTFMIEDDLSVYQTRYDGANRVIHTIDAELNEVLTIYDDNSNAVRTVEIEFTPREDVREGKVPNLRETFTTIDVFDSLNRLIRSTDDLGQTSRFHYDSRANLIFMSDAQGTPVADPLRLFAGNINTNGNTSSYSYDGLDRRITEVNDLRVDGQGSNSIDTSNPANPDGRITMMTTWDANSRLIVQRDDNGNTTVYQYDALNRLVKEIFADGTANVFSYDADDNRVTTLDENGSMITAHFDGINRRLAIAIQPARNVIGTTRQAFQYDGLSRLTQAVDNNELGDFNDDAVVTFAYDSLSRTMEEVQNGLAISSQWDGDARRLSLIYSNGRQIEFSYDMLDRIDTIKNSGSADNIVDYGYIGPSRVLERVYQNGVRLTHLNDSRTQDIGYDGLKRVVSHRHLDRANNVIAGFDYSYDRENNKLSERKLHQQGLAENYTYDSIYRLTNFSRDGEQPDTFQLDGVGNWFSRNGSANRVNTMNEYEMFAGVPQQYDENGNLIDDGTNRYDYDAFNRLVRVTRRADNSVIATYHYDAFGRRVERIVTNSGELNDQVRYFYDGWQEIEERRAGSTQQYVYGLWIDERVTMDKDRDNDGKIDATYYYHEDGRKNIVAVSDAQGGAVERYAYDAYGEVSVTNAKGEALARTSVSNPYLFAGRHLDPETGLYYYRMRYMNPETGRFIQRDPIGMWGDQFSLGNAYTYVINNPVNWIDPTGEIPAAAVAFAVAVGAGALGNIIGDAIYDWLKGDDKGCTTKTITVTSTVCTAQGCTTTTTTQTVTTCKVQTSDGNTSATAVQPKLATAQKPKLATARGPKVGERQELPTIQTFQKPMLATARGPKVGERQELPTIQTFQKPMLATARGPKVGERQELPTIQKPKVTDRCKPQRPLVIESP